MTADRRPGEWCIPPDWLGAARRSDPAVAPLVAAEIDQDGLVALVGGAAPVVVIDGSGAREAVSSIGCDPVRATGLSATTLALVVRLHRAGGYGGRPLVVDLTGPGIEPESVLRGADGHSGLVVLVATDAELSPEVAGRCRVVEVAAGPAPGP